MSVIRVEKDKNFTCMSNYHLRDKRLSLKAKGLMSEMLSLPDDWDYSVAGLVAINKEEQGAVNSALKELKEAGYLEVTKCMPSKDNGGRIEYEYVLHEKSVTINKKQEGSFQEVEIQGIEIQGIENRGQLNTNIINTKKRNTKDKNNREIDFLSLLRSNEEIGQDEELIQAFDTFLNMRKQIKKPIKTEIGLHRLVNRTWELSRGDHRKAISILQQSVSYEWLDVYPLRGSASDNENEFTALLREEGYTE